jgi:hypothetical protein
VVEKPALFLEIPNTFHARELGVAYRDLFTEGTTTPGGLVVSQRALGVNMSVDVAKGVTYVSGDDNLDTQPNYRCYNDAVVNLAIAAADATKPRVDRIVARVYDAQFFGAQNKWALEVLTGVATVGATRTNLAGAIAIPNNAVELARVEVAAAAGSIANANIFDYRPAARVGGLPLITTSPISGGPPASPADADIWIATGVDANGTRQSFQYNAGSASAFKWECIGGPPVFVAGAAVNTGLVVARAGDYIVHWSADCTASAGFWQDVLTVTSGVITGGAGQMTDSAAGQRDTLSGVARAAGLSAAATIAHGISGQSVVTSAQLAVEPVRIA